MVVLPLHVNVFSNKTSFKQSHYRILLFFRSSIKQTRFPYKSDRKCQIQHKRGKTIYADFYDYHSGWQVEDCQRLLQISRSTFVEDVLKFLIIISASNFDVVMRESNVLMNENICN